MLKCVYPTEAHKLGIIAATYRAGFQNIVGTCPSTCPLLPLHHRPSASTFLDSNYLAIERRAVPRNGIAWSYTHCEPNPLFYNHHPRETTLNVSTDSLVAAVDCFKRNYDTTYAAPASDTQWPRRVEGVRFIRCPAELHKHVTCQTCGGGRPLCARKNRDYVIVFVAHGREADKVGTDTGGCYAMNFPCSRHWNSTAQGIGRTTWDEQEDPERLLAWTEQLPKGTLLRHRIAGDLGIRIHSL